MSTSILPVATDESATRTEEAAPPVNMANGVIAGWFDWLPTWRPTSESQLIESERIILSNVKSEKRHLHVPVGPKVYIHTIVFEPETPPTHPAVPLVMIHGFGCGIPQYYKNYDHLHATRRLYSIDLPGYARSTRVQFTDDPETNENMFVEYLEQWRVGVGLDQFILLGHSFGGYLSAAYTIRYPYHVRHLVLNDPWGLPSRMEGTVRENERKLPMWTNIITSVITKFMPFSPVRMAGPAGPYLVKRVRADLARIFGDDFLSYVYHCNAQDPTGENAFCTMQYKFGWAIHPMLPRLISHLSRPISLIYGIRSWMDNSTGEQIRQGLPNSYVEVHYVKRAGHHLHVEQPEEFNRIVNHICSVVDRNEDSKPILNPAQKETELVQEEMD